MGSGKKRKAPSDEDPRRKRYGGGNTHIELNYENETSHGHDGSSKQETSGPLDPESGQRSAFPDLQLDDQPYSSNVPPQNVIQYLSMVRQEVAARPLFVSTKENFSREPKEAPPNTTTENTPAVYAIDLAKHEVFMTKYKILRQAQEDVQPQQWETYPQTKKEWRKLIVENEPDPAVIAALSEPVVISLLGYIHGWISPTIPPNINKWVIALLVRLPDTLVANDVAILRGLAKKCYGVRANKSVDQEVGSTLDQVIGIVSDFYRQHDLMPCVRELR